MFHDDSFRALMAGLRASDPVAETEVFRGYVRRLIALAADQFRLDLRERADVEDVVQSAWNSFFLRNRRGEFVIDDWEALWSTLATITLRKCSNRRDYLRAAMRSPSRESRWTTIDGRRFEVPDRAPSPDEVAIFAETLELFLGTVDPEERPILQQILMGYTAEQVAVQVDCSPRTVGRVMQRARRRLERLRATEESFG